MGARGGPSDDPGALFCCGLRLSPQLSPPLRALPCPLVPACLIGEEPGFKPWLSHWLWARPHPPRVSVPLSPGPHPPQTAHPFAVGLCEPAELPFSCSEIQQDDWKREKRGRWVSWTASSETSPRWERQELPRDPKWP